MKLISRWDTENPFESTALQLLAGSELDGIVTNNVVLPHHERSLPNEHDILVLMKGRIVTIDAKGLWAGEYRNSESGWEYRRVETDAWEPVLHEKHLELIARRKLNVLKKYVLDRLEPGMSEPELLSCIVVPDSADVTGLHVSADGRMAESRLYLLNLSRLVDGLRTDVKAFPKKKGQTPEGLAKLLGVDANAQRRSVAEVPLPGGVTVRERLGSPDLPIPHQIYLGEQKDWRRSVRVEICPVYASKIPWRAVHSAYRSQVLAVQQLRAPGVLALYDHAFTPISFQLVFEHFSRDDLGSWTAAARPSWSGVERVFRQVVATLCAAHAAGIYHRTLSPRSILVDRDGPDARLHCFYGAKTLDMTTMGLSPWTSAYAAPELGDRDASPAGLDHFSLGRCLTAALTGRPEILPSRHLAPEGVLAAVRLLTDTEPSRRQEGWSKLCRELGVS